MEISEPQQERRSYTRFCYNQEQPSHLPFSSSLEMARDGPSRLCLFQPRDMKRHQGPRKQETKPNNQNIHHQFHNNPTHFQHLANSPPFLLPTLSPLHATTHFPSISQPHSRGARTYQRNRPVTHHPQFRANEAISSGGPRVFYSTNSLCPATRRAFAPSSISTATTACSARLPPSSFPSTPWKTRDANGSGPWPDRPVTPTSHASS